MSLRKIRIKEGREVYRHRKYVVRERGRYTVIEKNILRETGDISLQKIRIKRERRYFAIENTY